MLLFKRKIEFDSKATTTNHTMNLKSLMYLSTEYDFQKWNNEVVRRRIDSKIFIGNIIDNVVELRSKSIVYWPFSRVILKQKENGSVVTIIFKANYLILSILILIYSISTFHIANEYNQAQDFIGLNIFIGAFGFCIYRLKKNLINIIKRI